MIIYKATNKINGKSYIGQTIYDLNKRRSVHLSKAKKGSKLYFHNALRKYGVKNFDWQILEQCDSDSDKLNEMECHYIKQCNTYEAGYNMTPGGEINKFRGKKHSEEKRKEISEKTKKAMSDPVIREKISKAKKGKAPWNKGIPMTEETKKKCVESKKGQIPWNKGKTNIYSEETKQKMGDVHLGKKHSKTTKQKMSESHKGKIFSEEHKQNISKSKLGSKHSEETKRKISETKRTKCQLR